MNGYDVIDIFVSSRLLSSIRFFEAWPCKKLGPIVIPHNKNESSQSVVAVTLHPYKELFLFICPSVRLSGLIINSISRTRRGKIQCLIRVGHSFAPFYYHYQFARSILKMFPLFLSISSNFRFFALKHTRLRWLIIVLNGSKKEEVLRIFIIRIMYVCIKSLDASISGLVIFRRRSEWKNISI